MIAVIFEVEPAGADTKARYLHIAGQLVQQLAQVDGFMGVERFQSLSAPDKLLSLSFFRDEAAVAAWRNLPAHRTAQAAGRSGVFAGYRLRVAQVIRDYGLTARDEAPVDSRSAHSD
ncbi:antibiotic biosynthesis monooxygenase family protein [Phenylobacterium deserti]|uniref:Antibiotic biosynthesis monooxygenase n=1 Tax=Phenylobacterium deserti TaxID=1914756 RepID=A0A328ACV6_9CAUL|nr:antibiotic biosynthesis monooxygenase [Phenylobacterium deserti]RAK52046.1 antibiotic biosynthesis monooxygenase [Phenylobacterium deserti]